MPIKRRIAKTKAHRITSEAIEAFERGDRMGLHRAVELKPWEVSPLDTDGHECPWPRGTGGAESWPKARALRAQILDYLGIDEAEAV